MARSRVFRADVIDNREPSFGANETYVAGWLCLDDGHERPLLLTDDQIGVAIARARNNPEDIGPRPGYWRRLWWAIRDL